MMELLNMEKSELSKMTKDKIIEQIMLMKTNYQNSFNVALQEIREDIKNIKTNLESSIDAKVKRIEEKFAQEVKEVKIRNAQLEQYGRRNNLEICGIPDVFMDNKIEEKTIELLNAIGMKVTSSDIEACHRLPKPQKNTNEPKRVIVRFINRKFAESAIKIKKQLQNFDGRKFGFNEKIFLNENLSPYFKEIYFKCRQLKKVGKIKYLWS